MLVKNIKYKNNKVEIVLDDFSVFVSKENYIENPVSIGSELIEERIDFLLNQEKIIDAKNNCIKLLNRKPLSEWEVEQYLKDKEIEFKDVKNIVNNLKNIGLISDEYVCSLLVDSLLMKKKGKLYIRKTLKEKKINNLIIERAIDEIDDEIYKENFNKVFDKYLKMYSNKSSKVKENMIKAKLKEYGYEESFISGLNVGCDKQEELELARKCYAKIIKNNKKDLDSYEMRNKIRLKLAMKGFNYDIINLVLEEVNDDETY